MTGWRFVSSLLLFAGHLLRPCDAQCSTSWLAGSALTGVSDTVVACSLWDPDGAGPAGPRLVVGGEFAVAGATTSGLVAAFDPTTGVWSGFGAGLTPLADYSAVRAFATLPTGELVVGGHFAGYLRRWNGSAWTNLGAAPFSNWVMALAVAGNGDLFAGGTGTGVWRWSGTTWSTTTSGYTNGVHVLTTLANGNVVAAGYVNTSGDSIVRRWNGTTWTALGGTFDDFIDTIVELPNGDLVAGGSFMSVGGVAAYGVARWNGSTWSAMGNGLHVRSAVSGEVTGLVPQANGDVIAVGTFTRSGSTVLTNIALWNGSVWSPYATAMPNYATCALALPGGDLVVGGPFVAIGSTNVYGIGRWNGSAWSPLGSGANGEVRSVAELSNGDIVVGGTFTQIGGVACNRIARWNGTTWSPLGSGTDGAVQALLALPGGEIVAGGWFGTMGGVTASRIARWNGSTWSALGTGMNDAVMALARLPNGEIVAGGYFTTAGGAGASHVARWNGTSWQPLGAGFGGGLQYQSVRTLLVLPDGSLAAGGLFTTAGGVPANRVARWDGTTWSPFGSGFAGGVVNALAINGAGQLHAAASFFSPQRVARWDGSTWSTIGGDVSGDADAIVCLPDGDVAVGGFFQTAGGMPVRNLARWNGATWSSPQNGTDNRVLALAMARNHLVAGGAFARTGTVASASFGRLATTCPTSAASLPTACLGPAGPVVATADSLPWIGANLRTHATGFAPGTFAVVVGGTSLQNVLLSTLTPTGGAGCELFPAPEALAVVSTVGGTASFALYIPDNLGLVGAPLWLQYLQIELPGGVWTGTTGSNGLAFTAGAF